MKEPHWALPEGWSDLDLELEAMWVSDFTRRYPQGFSFLSARDIMPLVSKGLHPRLHVCIMVRRGAA